MLCTKPLSSRADGIASQPTRVRRGVPLSSAGSFAALMPANSPPAQAAPGKTTQESAAEQAKQNNMGLNQTRAMATLARVMENSPAPLGTLNSAQGALGEGLLNSLSRGIQRPSGLEGAETALRVNSHRQKKRPQERMSELATRKLAAIPLPDPGNKTSVTSPQNVGALAARFESGAEGIAAIGYDRHGGTSYGKYQISSKAGTLGSFISFLKTEEPEWARRLEQSGPGNTGGKSGQMPERWRQMAEEAPERFEALQDKFIHNSHFQPAVEAIAEKTGLAFDDMPVALKEVLFSTAVQHGPNGAARMFSRAVDQIGQAKLDPDKTSPEHIKKEGEKLIRRIYAMRSDQFGSSTPTVQSAVKSRLKQEMSLAIDMLQQEQISLS